MESHLTPVNSRVKEDPLTDLFEDLAAEQKARATYDNILRVVRNIPEIARSYPFSPRKGSGAFQAIR